VQNHDIGALYISGSDGVDPSSILQTVPPDSSRDRLCAHIKLTFDGGTEFSICVVRLEARLDSRRMNDVDVASLTSTETMKHALHTHTLSICYITRIAIARLPIRASGLQIKLWRPGYNT